MSSSKWLLSLFSWVTLFSFNHNHQGFGIPLKMAAFVTGAPHTIHFFIPFASLVPTEGSLGYTVL